MNGVDSDVEGGVGKGTDDSGGATKERVQRRRKKGKKRREGKSNQGHQFDTCCL